MGAVRCAVVLSLLLPTVAASQKAQSFSLMAAGLTVDVMGQDFTGTRQGTGYEVHVRFHSKGIGGPSFGVGYYSTRHPTFNEPLTVWGLAFEPRHSFSPDSSSSFRPYVMGRFASVHRKQRNFRGSTGSAIGGGGGAVVQVATKFLIDVSVAFGLISFTSDPSFQQKGTALSGRLGGVFLLGI